MRSLSSSRFFLFFFILLIGSSQAFADVLIMKNGDRLTGEVVTKTGDNLTFKTPYGEPFVIDWHEVKTLNSDEPIKIINEDDLSVTETKEIDESSPYYSDKPRARKYTFNPEPWRLGEGTKFSGRVNVLFDFNRGNTDTDEMDVDFLLEARNLKNRYTLNGFIEDDEANGVTTNKNTNIRADYDRFIDQKTYLTASTNYEKDELADLDRRMTYGGGIGYQFLDDDKKNLSLEAGPAWVDENFIVAPNNEYWAGQWQLKYEHYIITDRLQFYHRQVGTWNMEDTDDVLLDAWLGLRAPIYHGIIASLEYLVEYNSTAPSGTKDADETYGVKLGYQW